MNSIRWGRAVASIAGMIVLLQAYGSAADRSISALDHGFHLLYNLDFAAAQQQFESYERDNPEDPLGPTSEAAGLLFAELNRLGVLDSGFFNYSSRSRAKLAPDPLVYARFDSALRRSDAIARNRLNRDAKDRDALFAVTLGSGVRADYTALVQRRSLAALGYTKDATKSAQLLLAVCPDCYDAYVATGISRYLIGTSTAPTRWVLRLAGFQGDKQRGIEDLGLAAERGHYLAPFARILLALIYVQEKDSTHARELLARLHAEFPGNPLFVREIARLDGADPETGGKQDK
jgi:hypothetical protein